MSLEEIPEEAGKLFFDIYNYDWENEDFDQFYQWLESPFCDKATVLLIFWFSKPEFFNQFNNREEAVTFGLGEHYDFVRFIEQGFLNDKWKNEYIIFDPEKSEFLNQYIDLSDVFVYEIDDKMYEKTNGKVNAYEVINHYFENQ